MIIVGVAFLCLWLLVGVLNVPFTTAALIVGIGFILLGLLIGERPKL